MKRTSLLLACVVSGLILVGCGGAKENIPLGPEGAPAAVTSAFKKSYPDAKITEVRKKTYKDGSVKYNVEFKDAAGAGHEVNYNDKGEIVK